MKRISFLLPLLTLPLLTGCNGDNSSTQLTFGTYKEEEAIQLTSSEFSTHFENKENFLLAIYPKDSSCMCWRTFSTVIDAAVKEKNFTAEPLESNGKKIAFLKEVTSKLGLDNVEIIQGRAEEFTRRESFDIVTARAVKELNILLEICFHLVKVNGVFVAYKSSSVDEELSRAKGALKALEIKQINRYEYSLPKSKDNRVLLEILKSKATKNKYPREYSKIVKSPL